MSCGQGREVLKMSTPRAGRYGACRLVFEVSSLRRLDATGDG